MFACGMLGSNRPMYIAFVSKATARLHYFSP
jgi:hypothetical protein